MCVDNLWNIYKGMNPYIHAFLPQPFNMLCLMLPMLVCLSLTVFFLLVWTCRKKQSAPRREWFCLLPHKDLWTGRRGKNGMKYTAFHSILDLVLDVKVFNDPVFLLYAFLFRVAESPAQARKMQQKPKSPITNRCQHSCGSLFHISLTLCSVFTIYFFFLSQSAEAKSVPKFSCPRSAEPSGVSSSFYIFHHA